MALRKAKAPLIKVTGNLFREDWEWLLATCPKTGAFVVVRELVRNRVAELRKQVAESRKTEEGIELESA